MPRTARAVSASAASRNGWNWPPLTAAERRTIEADPWFSKLTAPLQQSILESSVVRRFDDGTEIAGPATQGNEWFGVASGVVSLSVEAEPGLSVLLGHVEPGAWFNDLSLFSARQRPHDARAHGETALLAVSERDFRALLSKHADFAPALFRLNAWRTRQLIDEFVDLKIRPLRIRLARKILQLASRYGVARAGETLIGLALVQHDLAMLLGASRQRVNQQLKDFERQGLIRVEPARLVVLSRPGLTAIAESREG